MDFDFNEEQKMFQQAARDFCVREVAPLVEKAEAQEETPLQLFPRMGSLGYLCARYPAKYGAAEMGKISECILLEELARISGGIAAAMMVHSGLGTAMINDHGSEELKQKYLVPAIKGQSISAFGLTEPNAGSDAANMSTKAVKQGDHYIINGNKIFITNGPYADFVCVAAYTDKSKGAGKGVSVFVVEKGSPGFSVARKMEKLGNRSAGTAELVFDNCIVPANNLVGEEGKGFRYVMETLDGGRIAHAARSLGVAQAAFEASVKYSNERVQFGQPIGKFQAISFKLARMAMQLEAARCLTYYAAWMYDQKRRCLKEASMAKLFASEVVIDVTAEAMEIHGGYGYMMDSPVQRYYRDARLYPITEGTSEIMHVVISREIGAP